MAEVRVTTARPTLPGRLILISSSGKIVPFPTTPPTLNFSNGSEYGTLSRQGKKAVTRKTGQSLRTLGFTQLVASPDYVASVESILRSFDKVAEAGEPIRFNGGSAMFHQACWWTVKSLTTNVTALAPNNSASRAELSWSLEEYVGLTSKIGRVAKPPVPKAPPAVVPAASRTYTVVSGDSLWAIAARLLGNGVRWPEIHRLNLGIIANPNLIFPGQVLRVP